MKIKLVQEIIKTVNYYSLKYQDSSKNKNSLDKEEIQRSFKKFTKRKSFTFAKLLDVFIK